MFLKEENKKTVEKEYKQFIIMFRKETMLQSKDGQTIT